jgi:hypothetical protein
MRKTTFIVSLLALLVCYVLPAGLCGMRTGLNSRPFVRVEDLVLDESAFPLGWQATSDEPWYPEGSMWGPTPYNAIAALGYRGDAGSASYKVMRYVTTAKAAGEYERLEGVFCADEWTTLWIVPGGVTYQSPVADQFRFGCARKGSVPMCRALGQYSEYIVELYMSGERGAIEVMPAQDMERILRAIDERMTSRLGLKPHLRPTATRVPYPPPPGERTSGIMKRLVDTSVFPAGWFEVGPTEIDKIWLVDTFEDAATTEIRIEDRDGYPGAFVAKHSLYRYPTEQQAAAAYRVEESRQFIEHEDNEYYTPWEVPAGLPYRSPVADQFRFACQTFFSRGGPEVACKAMGRYGSYLSVFKTVVHEGHLTYDELGRILRAIDEQMAP